MDTTQTILVIFMLILIIMSIATAIKQEYILGYKQGQIDAINGIIKYKLVEFEDGNRRYYKESELKDLKGNFKIIK